MVLELPFSTTVTVCLMSCVIQNGPYDITVSYCICQHCWWLVKLPVPDGLNIPIVQLRLYTSFKFSVKAFLVSTLILAKTPETLGAIAGNWDKRRTVRGFRAAVAESSGSSTV